MTFLNPAILFGLFAAGIPIALHFLNLRNLKKVNFSTLSFLKELQKTKIKKIKLKQWLLLLLRTSIIILLVMAFARPALKGPLGGGSAPAQTSAVIIIDNTFCMSALTANGSHLNQAKNIAKNLLSGFRKNDDVTIIPVSEPGRAGNRESTDFSSVSREIDNLQISPVSGTLYGAITAAAGIIGDSKNFNKEIYILTDLQKGRFYDSIKELSDLSSVLNNKVRLFLIDLGDKQPANAGIDDIWLNSQIIEKGKKISVGAKIRNYSSNQAAKSVLSLFVNGRRSAQQNIELNASGTKEISFQIALNDTGLIELSAELEDDDIPGDNKRYLGVYVPARISVLILTDNHEDGRFVRLAAGNSDASITESEYSKLPSLKLNGYDAIILFDPGKSFDTGNLLSYIESGHGIVLMPGSRTTLPGFRNFCASFGIPAPSSAVGKQGLTESITRFDKTDFQNPVFSDLFENKKERLESPGIYYYFKILPGPSGKNLISLTDNSSFLSEYSRGTGKIFLFSSAPLPDWNNFPLKGFFAPLMTKIIFNCAYRGSNLNSSIAGLPIDVNISAGPLSQIRVIRPDGRFEMINTDSLASKKYLSYSETNSLGIFRFYSGGKLLDYWSINHDPRESVAEAETHSAFNNFLKEISFGGTSFLIQPSDDIQKVVYQSRFGTELWKYFLLTVLFLALLESLVSRAARKDMPAATADAEFHSASEYHSVSKHSNPIK